MNEISREIFWLPSFPGNKTSGNSREKSLLEIMYVKRTGVNKVVFQQRYRYRDFVVAIKSRLENKSAVILNILKLLILADYDLFGICGKPSQSVVISNFLIIYHRNTIEDILGKFFTLMTSSKRIQNTHQN